MATQKAPLSHTTLIQSSYESEGTTKAVKLYHITHLYYQGSSSRPLVKLEETSTISPTCLVVHYFNQITLL